MHEYQSKTRGIPPSYRGEPEEETPAPGWIILLMGAVIGGVLMLLSNVSLLAPTPRPELGTLPPATPAPAAPTSATILPADILAYDAPGGTIIGPIEAGRAYTVLVEQDGWMQLEVDGSGAIWTEHAGSD